MVDRKDSVSEGETWEGAFSLESRESSAKGVCYKDIKKGGERAPLSYPSRGI